MRYGSIYLVTNKINSKKYIGQTIFPVEIRWKAHYKANSLSSALHSAIHKYGLENFTFEEICSAKNEDDLNFLEEYLIKYYNSYGNNGYNKTYGGDASSGKFTPEVREKMRLAKLGKKRGHYKVNQSGSLETKESRHAQRLGDELAKANCNSPTSSRQPSKYEQLKEEIIKIYNESNSSHIVSEKLNLDKSMIISYLKKWEIAKNQSEAASQRNINRYLIDEEIKNLILVKYSLCNNKVQVAKELNISRKLVYRVLKAEKIV